MDWPTDKYRCIVVDPPWPQATIGRFKGRRKRPDFLAYQTMTLGDIYSLDIAGLAEPDAHLWLWTTNAHLSSGFRALDAWGFHYLTTITWVKPSGFGAWFANTTQHCLFGYYQRCYFPQARFRPTHFHASPRRTHSRKPDEFYSLVRSISPQPRIDLFNRREIAGFEGWGDESPRQMRLAQ